MLIVRSLKVVLFSSAIAFLYVRNAIFFPFHSLQLVSKTILISIYCISRKFRRSIISSNSKEREFVRL